MNRLSLKCIEYNDTTLEIFSENSYKHIKKSNRIILKMNEDDNHEHFIMVLNQVQLDELINYLSKLQTIK